MTAPASAPRAVAIGDRSPARTFGPLTRTDIVRYAGASGDFNPIHHDECFAKDAGFPTVFSIGMLQAGLLATYAAEWLGPENVRSFTVRFSQLVWPGDELICEGVVRELDHTDEASVATVELTCRRAAGEVAIRGEAVFHLPTAGEASWQTD